MKIDFNNVRKQALHAYDKLVSKLNASILKESQYAIPNDVKHGSLTDIEGYVLLDAKDITDDINELRQLIAVIAMTFEEGNEDMKDVFVEVYKEDEAMEVFNPQD